MMRIDVLTYDSDRFQDCLNENKKIEKRLKYEQIKLVVHDLKLCSKKTFRQSDYQLYGSELEKSHLTEEIIECLKLLRYQRKYDEIILLNREKEVSKEITIKEFVEKKALLIICAPKHLISNSIREYIITKVINFNSEKNKDVEEACLKFCKALLNERAPGRAKNTTTHDYR